MLIFPDVVDLSCMLPHVGVHMVEHASLFHARKYTSPIIKLGGPALPKRWCTWFSASAFRLYVSLSVKVK